MISTLELRHLIESAFLPLSCECRSDPSGTLKVQISDPTSGRVELLVTGICMTRLTGNQALSTLITEIREELQVTHERR